MQVPEPRFRTFGDMSRSIAAQRGVHRAVICDDRILTYAELDSRANQIANALSAAGIGKGGLVGILARNSDTYIEIIHGAARLGATLVVLNWRCTAHEIAATAEEVDFSLLFVEEEFLSAASAISARKIVFSHERDENPEYEAFVNSGSVVDAKFEVSPDDVLFLMFTSGTTGKPKGVPTTHYAHLYGLSVATMAGDVSMADDINLLVTPLFHLAGLGWSGGSVLTGGTLIILPKPDVDNMVEAIERYRVTRTVFMAAVMPLFLDRMEKGADLSSLRSASYGASATPGPWVERITAAIGCGFMQNYGMSEAAGSVTHLDPSDHFAGSPWLESCGRAYPGAEIKITDDHGQECKVGEIGEVCVRMPSLIKGYWNNPEATAAAFRDGWYLSGDMGYLDEHGYLFICDRKKDMIISGGENIFPTEIESVAAGFPGVEKVAVIGVPSERWGEEVKAFIVPRSRESFEREKFIAFLRERLAGYKTPRSLEIVDELPLTSLGKVAKFELRERYWAGYSRRVN